ncbi:hypothetical protein NFJ02_39g98060 [Pycnococcus provasolii]
MSGAPGQMPGSGFDHGKATRLIRATDKVGALLVLVSVGAYVMYSSKKRDGGDPSGGGALGGEVGSGGRQSPSSSSG